MPPHPSHRRSSSARPPTDRATSTPSPTARRIAFEILTGYDASRPQADDERLGTPHVTQLLDDRLARLSFAPQERRLTTELVYGIVRRRATLAAVLAKFVSRPRENIEDGLWRLLELGAYQLVLLTGVPPHAAVSETVLLAKDLGKPQWSGFLNGVLRNIGRELTDEFGSEPSPNGVPLGETSEHPEAVRYRLLGGELFPDPANHPAEYLSAAFSYPRWLIDGWLARWGWEESLRRAIWFNSPGRMALRVNRQRMEQPRYLSLLAKREIAASHGDVPNSIRLAKPTRVEDLPGFREGWFSIQDESAQQAALLLDPQPGERVLDLCAAPGGKSTHLAELMGDQGRVVACDVHPSRLQRIIDSRERLGLTCIETKLITTSGGDLPEGPFDAALVDVPCSNTGVLGKRPDVRWRIGPQDLVELPALQMRLLLAAVDLVRPGGRIVYSTCSIEPIENEQLVNQLLESVPGLTVEREIQHSPARPGDGAYQALLRKN